MIALEHINDHDALFKVLANVRNNFLAATLPGQEFHKLPPLQLPDGRELAIEPERSIILPRYQVMEGIKNHLEQNIPGFRIVKNSECGFRYPTAAIAGPDAPFIKRFRSDLFYEDLERKIYVPKHMSYGVKSRGKGDNRLEYEVDVDENRLDEDPSQLFIGKYGDDLPSNVLGFTKLEPIVHGWMCVKRAAFDAIYTNKAELGDISVVVSMSVDAFNIGAKPDLSFHDEVGSSIAVQNAELEWEGMGYITPKGYTPSNAEIWDAMNKVVPAIGDAVEDMYSSIIIPSDESKTERILSTVFNHGATAESIAEMNLKPWEFLQTESTHRKKTHAPEQYVNFLGRLNRQFYQQAHNLPDIHDLHALMSEPAPTNTRIYIPR